MERHGLLEMLISCNEGACVLQSVARCLRVCLSERCLRKCVGCLPLPLGAAPVTPFYSRKEAQGRYMYLLRGIFVLAEAACPSPAACHYGSMVGGAVLSSVHSSDVLVMPVPVVAGAPSSIGGELVTVGLTSVECRGRVDAMARVR